MKSIKDFLLKNNFDYFLLPNSNEFFLEYLPKNHKRIEFISGFTGSNATIIFGQNKNYFFTDGRYIIQAQKQIDINQYEIINISHKTPLEWLKENLNSQHNLAVDPKLLSKNFIDECDKFLTKITFVHKNPADELWVERPNINNNEAFCCPENITGESFSSKKQKLLTSLKYDGIFISKPENVNWLLNIRGDDIENTPLFIAQALLIKDGKMIVFCDKSRVGKLNLESVDFVDFAEIESYFKNFVQAKISIQTDFKTTNYWIFEVFEKNNLKIFHQTCPLEKLKSIKNPIEINGSRSSHFYDAIAVTKFLIWFKNCQKISQKNSEISAEQKLFELRKDCPHFLYPSFETISGFESNGAIIHYRATSSTDKQIVGNSLYLVDSGGQYFGSQFCGTTDITRTMLVGKASESMIGDYTRVLKGHIALARAIFMHGTTGSQLDILARYHLWQAQKNYDHGTGHGVGSFLSVHEGPCSISKNSHVPLEAGMILSNEPGYYEEGQYGIRLENLMLVVDHNEKFLGFETLSLAPFDLDLIDFRMLTYPEKKWLKEYHQKILLVIGNHLSNHEIAGFIEHFGIWKIDNYLTISYTKSNL